MKKNHGLIAAFILVILLTDCIKKKEVWYCPMHPDYHSDHPGTCPICNMTLVKQESAAEKSVREKDERMSHAPGDMPTGEEGVIVIDEEKQALIGIKTVIAGAKVLKKRISTSGSVAYDPELYTAIMEHRDALRLVSSGSNEDRQLNSVIVRSTKSRLKQLGLSDAQIREWSRPAKDPSVLVTGSNHGTAYIYSRAFESDVGMIRPGLKVEVVVNSYPDLVFKGVVRGVDTILDSKNRTLRIRSEVADRNNILKPQMFADVNIFLNLGKVIAVPKSAVMDTGVRKLVYVRLPGSRFSAREVKTGNSTDDDFEIVSGLKAGEEVVTGANFLLDSESRIKLGNPHEGHIK